MNLWNLTTKFFQMTLPTHIMFPGNWASMRVSTDITGEVDIITFLNQKYDNSVNLKLTNNIPWSGPRLGSDQVWATAVVGLKWKKQFHCLMETSISHQGWLKHFVHFVSWFSSQHFLFSFPMHLFYPIIRSCALHN